VSGFPAHLREIRKAVFQRFNHPSCHLIGAFKAAFWEQRLSD